MIELVEKAVNLEIGLEKEMAEATKRVGSHKRTWDNQMREQAHMCVTCGKQHSEVCWMIS